MYLIDIILYYSFWLAGDVGEVVVVVFMVLGGSGEGGFVGFGVLKGVNLLNEVEEEK
jgi:hypothetical protein